MKTGQNNFQALFEEYLINQVELKIIKYIGGDHPRGGKKLGSNFDTGEVHSFDIKITNKGELGILNMALSISANHGKISGSYSGHVNIVGSHWISPWNKNWISRKFNLKAKKTIILQHERSGGHLFGYSIQEPTKGGGGGSYETEDLLIAEVAYWQPDVNSLMFKPKNSPSDKLRGYIQRN